MELADLPTRRIEAWKYSDLRLALRDTELPNGGERMREAEQPTLGPIERLARGQGTQVSTVVASGRNEVLIERLENGELDARARDIRVAPGATLTRIVIQDGLGVALSVVDVSVGAGGRYRQFVLAEGGKLARIETRVSVQGEGAQVELNGVYMCAEGRHADLTSVVEHGAGNGVTRQLVKGAVRGGGRGVFQGKIIVDRGAQRTDARQYHHALLLEDGAEAFAKPELIINADDVQCAHGNTVGALDADSLFYLRQRGLPRDEARALLTEAFLLEAVPEDLGADTLAELRGRITAWLRRAP